MTHRKSFLERNFLESLSIKLQERAAEGGGVNKAAQEIVIKSPPFW